MQWYIFVNFSFYIEERDENNDGNSHKNGFMHSMKKRKRKNTEPANISAEKVTSETTTQNQTNQNIDINTVGEGRSKIV